MLRLVFGALRRRGAQSLAVFALAALFVAVAAAGPLFDAAAAARTTAADLAGTTAADRLLSVRRPVASGSDPAAALADFRRAAEAVLPPPGGPVALGLTQTLIARVDGLGKMVPLAYRDNACDHMRIEGACPAAPGEAVVSRAAAKALGRPVGGEIELRTQQTGAGTPLTVRIVGLYDRADPGGGWWADPSFAPGRIAAGEETVDPVFLPIGAFTGMLAAPTAVYTVPAPQTLLEDGFDATAYALKSAGFDFTAPPDALVAQISGDRAATRRGVLAGWVQALVLCALALGIVGRYTAQDRRPDYALLQLRGATRARTVRLTVWQQLLPMLAALPAGLALGWASARLAAGAPAPVRAFAPAGIAAAVALAAGLALLVLADLPLLRTPVAELLRRAPAPGRRGAALFDLLLVAGAVAALFQVRSQEPAAVPSGLAVIAPVLLTLAAATLLARLVTALAGRAGRAVLRAGRVPAALAALQYHRRPGIDRIFALVAVAVALLGLAGGDLLAGRDARADRTAVELGAERVLTVRAASQATLLRAVRLADPGGRDAMAVALDDTTDPPVLAVDASRLAAVTRGAGALPAETAAALAPGRAGELPPVEGTGLTLAARNDSPGPLRLTVQLANTGTGAAVSVTLGPFAPGEHEASAPLAGCGAPGCRIVALALAGPGDQDGKPAAPAASSALTVRSLRQNDASAPVLDADRLGDPRRWRAVLTGPGIVVAPSDGALTLRMPPPPEEGTSQSRPDTRAYVVDGALPIPAVLAGDAPRGWASAEPTVSPFGSPAQPLRIAARRPVLPVLGGAGLVLDLDAVQRALPGPASTGTLQVWLAAGVTPARAAAIADRLAAAGVEVVGSETAAQHRARLAEQGTAFAGRFRLLSAVAGLLLAAVAAAAAVSVERRVRAAEVRAMRVQGVPARATVTAGAGGQAALLVLGTLGGLVAAAFAGWAIDAPVAAFVDDWHLTAPPPALRPGALGLAGLAALAVLAVASGPALLTRPGGRKGAGR
ncbi:FtsX-like permease family protein [Dactylosporangium sp. NPDC000244]|uniref:FtsX-like permease family protein n=1 Tax=Dactylosporangium sp. NPDC000244 TaxID=3154365 RepID=UPI003324E608